MFYKFLLWFQGIEYKMQRIYAFWGFLKTTVDWKAGVHTQEPACAGESIINFLSNEDTPWLCRRVLHYFSRYCLYKRGDKGTSLIGHAACDQSAIYSPN
jgi:hypothetical protein